MSSAVSSPSVQLVECRARPNSGVAEPTAHRPPPWHKRHKRERPAMPGRARRTGPEPSCGDTGPPPRRCARQGQRLPEARRPQRDRRRKRSQLAAKGWAAAHPRPAAGRRQPPAAAPARPGAPSRRFCRRGAPRPPSCRQTAASAAAGGVAPPKSRAPQPAAPRSWRPRHSACSQLRLSGPPQTTRTELWQQRKDEKKMRKVGRRLAARGCSGGRKGGLGRKAGRQLTPGPQQAAGSHQSLHPLTLVPRAAGSAGGARPGRRLVARQQHPPQPAV